ncbi:CgeB family protein [Nocardioides currus]|uniref:CgeB family protein n=1 Tax=Nocardioides currus TaxID=2133958 RepID=UPI001A9C6196|nr:glycosyltransferase [Nocardioides currus]
MTERRVLLVSPAFHGYHGAIAASLEARGHTVVRHVYDQHLGMARRVGHQIRHELPQKVGVGSGRRLGREQTAAAIEAVRDTRPDAVVVVKGDALEPSFWEHLSTAGLPRVTWLYDEVRRTRYTPELLSEIGPLATYSILDDEAFNELGWDTRYLPLAFDHRLTIGPARPRTKHVTFVGARYPSRQFALESLAAAGVPVRAYGRDWSSHPVDRLRTWSVRRPDVTGLRDVDRATAYRVMASSTATLNLHGDQDGFTMRTFEAAGVGALQIVDRTDTAGLYRDGVELVAFTSLEELVDLCHRAASDAEWAESIRAAARERTLAEHTFDHRVAELEAAWDTV